jgi:hypothetical protein
MVFLRKFGRALLGSLLGLGITGMAGMAGMVGLGLLSASPAAAVTPFGETFSVDTAPDCQERDPDVATLPGGGFVTVWVASDAGAPGFGRVYARIYDANRNPVTGEFRVSASGTGQDVPAVAVGTDGRFLVVWRDSTEQIRGRLFEPSGTPAGAEFLVGFLFPVLGGQAQTPDVVASPAGGGFAVVWNDGGAVLLRRFEADGEPFDAESVLLEAHDPGILGLRVAVLSPAITALGHRNYFVAYTLHSTVVGREPTSRILARPIRDFPSPDQETGLELYTPLDSLVGAADVAADADGNLLLAWREEWGPQGRLEIRAQSFFANGHARAAVFRVDEGFWSRLGDPDVLMDPSGSFLVGWSALINTDIIDPPPPYRDTVFARQFDLAGLPQGGTAQISAAFEIDRVNPAFAWTRDRQAIAVWQDGRTPQTTGPPPCFSAGISARGIGTGCLAGPNRLCLGEGRFQLEASWAAPQVPGGSGPGSAAAITRDTGYFWFFEPDNVELVVKVLDGRALNGNFWVFYGSLSDVAWTLTVTDLVTGAAKTYSNPAGQLASRGDTAGLPGVGAAAALGQDTAGVIVQELNDLRLDREALPAPGWEAGLDLPSAGAGMSNDPGFLTPHPSVLHLQGAFEVDVAWRDPFNNTAGVGHGIPLTFESGYFWFFHPDNVELVVKVLDGRALNGHYWVFYGALTNVEYDLRVRHRPSGNEKTYHNAPFRFRSRADTQAFPGTLP